MEGSGRGIILRHYPSFFPERLKKTMRTPNHSAVTFGFIILEGKYSAL
jgi:hypothetical protein